MRKDDILASKDYVTAQDLINKPLISSRRSSVQNELFNWFGTEVDRLNIISTFNLILNASAMVEEALGYAFSFESLINVNEESNIFLSHFFPRLKLVLY